MTHSRAVNSDVPTKIASFMNIAIVCLLIVFNLAISGWNAYVCGKTWVEAKAHGGWPRFMTWMAATMSALGFTWCYIILLAAGALGFHWLTPQAFQVALELGYLVVVPGFLFSGLMITVDSWAQAYRQGGVLNYGAAAYNTYAQIHNSLSAVSNMGSAFADVVGFFGSALKGGSSDSDDDSAAAILALLIVAIGLFAGVITTSAIITRVAATDRLLSREEMELRTSRGSRG